MSPDTPGFRTLCPTRWTVRAAYLESVIANYVVLQSLWEECYEGTKDSEIRARVTGVEAKMINFEFLFGVCLAHDILRHTDNLSIALQNKTISAAEGQKLAAMTTDTLQELRSEAAYDTFWERVNGHLDIFDVDEPTLPRRRKKRKRFESGSASSEFCSHTRRESVVGYLGSVDRMSNSF